MRLLSFLILLVAVGASNAADESPFELFAWERGIGLHPRETPEMKVYLWFYEWNMFGAVEPNQHSRGDWENDVTIHDGGARATVDCGPHFVLQAKTDETGAELTLEATNASDRDWPELAGIIACFNPGPQPNANPQFENENTFFRAPEGLLKLQKREIHWNDNLRPQIKAVQPDGVYVWDEKWPTAEPNATGGFLMRESNDGAWRTGIAWERFLSCQGHNPWKCMHLGIHLGPMAAGAKRSVRGKIYLVQEAAQQLLDRYDRDFPRPDEIANARKPKDEEDLHSWMRIMAIHGFKREEIRAATGLGDEQLNGITLPSSGFSSQPAGLLVLPYPGGRHPRIGFHEGAVRPQRETKVSIFTPWMNGSYVVADVPEAIWYNREDGERELLYLAHEHVPTLWTRKDVKLERREWREEAGALVSDRQLPNGVEFGTRVRAVDQHVELEQWLTNGMDRELTGLRVQNCVMLKGAPEFAQQSQENKFYRDPYAACRDADGKRWIITAWENCVRPWGNARCPCLHSDPQFPDCPPGETVKLRGIVWFYEGEDIEAELDRMEATGWRR
ncbi:MAG: hypothetical protein AAF585_04520 [Verrucomicrobiota bacterium]